MQGESSECNTLNIFWRDISIPSSLYIISAGSEYQKAWRWVLDGKSGKLEWDLALPVGNRFLVTVAGRQYAGFEGPRTVMASNNQSCLSTRAKEISHQRTAQSEPRSGLSQGAVIGTAIGAATLVLMAAAVAWLLVRKRRASAVRPGEINLHDEWQSASHEHHHVLPFLHKTKTVGNAATSAVPPHHSPATRAPEPQQEIDADAPMRINGPAPPSYNHVLWVTQPPDAETTRTTRNSALMEAKSAILTATAMSISGSSTASQPREDREERGGRGGGGGDGRESSCTALINQGDSRPPADVPGSTSPSLETLPDAHAQPPTRPLPSRPE